ncbi:hypothetical protein ABE444_07620 [Brevundimonas pondensis]
MSFDGQLILTPLRQRRDHDRLDQPAHQVARLGRRFTFAAVKRLSEVAHHAAIVLCDPWVQRYGGGRFLGCQVRFQNRALVLKRGQFVFDRCAAQDAVGHLVDQALRPTDGFGQVGFQLGAAASNLPIALLHFQARLFHGGGNDVRRQQAVPEGRQHTVGDIGALDPAPVVAGGWAALASPRTDESLLGSAADHRAAAAAAGQLAAEQVLRAHQRQ